MSSIWKINGGDIYVNEYGKEVESQIAELNAIDSDEDTTFHKIYTPTPSITVAGIVIGEAHLNTIESGEGGNVTLITDLQPSGFTVLLTKVTANRQNVACQFVDHSQPTTAPVYEVTCEVRGSES